MRLIYIYLPQILLVSLVSQVLDEDSLSLVNIMPRSRGRAPSLSSCGTVKLNYAILTIMYLLFTWRGT